APPSASHCGVGQQPSRVSFTARGTNGVGEAGRAVAVGDGGGGLLVGELAGAARAGGLAGGAPVGGVGPGGVIVEVAGGAGRGARSDASSRWYQGSGGATTPGMHGGVIARPAGWCTVSPVVSDVVEDSPVQLTVREATPEDAPAIAALLRALMVYYEIALLPNERLIRIVEHVMRLPLAWY